MTSTFPLPPIPREGSPFVRSAAPSPSPASTPSPTPLTPHDPNSLPNRAASHGRRVGPHQEVGRTPVKVLERSSSRGHAVAMLRKAALDRSTGPTSNNAPAVPTPSGSSGTAIHSVGAAAPELDGLGLVASTSALPNPIPLAMLAPLPPTLPSSPLPSNQLHPSTSSSSLGASSSSSSANGSPPVGKSRAQALVDKFEAISRAKSPSANKPVNRSPPPRFTPRKSFGVAAEADVDPAGGDGETTPRAKKFPRVPPPRFDVHAPAGSSNPTGTGLPDMRYRHGTLDPELMLGFLPPASPDPPSPATRFRAADSPSATPWGRLKSPSIGSPQTDRSTSPSIAHSSSSLPYYGSPKGKEREASIVEEEDQAGQEADTSASSAETGQSDASTSAVETDEDSIQPWQTQLASPASSALASLRSGSEISLGTSGTSLERADSAAARMESLARLTGAKAGPAPTSRGLPAFLLGKHREEAERRGFPGTTLAAESASPTAAVASPQMLLPGPLPGLPMPNLGEGHGLGFGVGLGGRGVPRLSALQRKALERIANESHTFAGVGGVVGGAALNRSHTTTGSEARREQGRLALGALRNRKPIEPPEAETGSPVPGPSEAERSRFDRTPPVIVEEPSFGTAEQPAVNEEAVAQDARQQARSNLMRKLSNRGARTPPFEPSPSLPQTAVLNASAASTPPTEPLPDPPTASSSSRLAVVRPRPRPRSGSMGDLPSLMMGTPTEPLSLKRRQLEAQMAKLRETLGIEGSPPIRPRKGIPREKPSAVIDRLAASPISPPPVRNRPTSAIDDEEQPAFSLEFQESPTAPDFSSPLLRSTSQSSHSSPGGLLAPPTFLTASSHPSPNSPNSFAPTTASTRVSGVSAYTTTSQFRSYRHSTERDRDSLLDKMGLASDGGAWDLERYALTPRNFGSAASSSAHHEDAEEELEAQSPIITFSESETQTPLMDHSASFAAVTPSSTTSQTPHTPDLRSPGSASTVGFSPATFPQSPESALSRSESPANNFRPYGGVNLGLAMHADEQEAVEESIPIILDESPGHSRNQSAGRTRVIQHHPRGPSFGRSTGAPAKDASVTSFPASVSTNSVAESDTTVTQGRSSVSKSVKEAGPAMGAFRFPPVSEEVEVADQSIVDRRREDWDETIGRKRPPPPRPAQASYNDRVYRAMEEMSKGHSSSGGSLSSASPMFREDSHASSVGHSSHQTSASTSTNQSVQTPSMNHADRFNSRQTGSPISPLSSQARYSDPKLAPFPGSSTPTTPATTAANGTHSRSQSNAQSSHDGSSASGRSLKKSIKGAFMASAASVLRNRSRSNQSSSGRATPQFSPNASHSGHGHGKYRPRANSEREHLSPSLLLNKPLPVPDDRRPGSRRDYLLAKLAPFVSAQEGKSKRTLSSHFPVLQIVDQATIKDRVLLIFNDILVIAKPVLAKDSVSDRFEVPTLGSSYTVKHVLALCDVKAKVPSATSSFERLAAKPVMRHFPRYFKSSPDDAVVNLLDEGYIKADPVAIATLLFETPDLDRHSLASYLSEDSNRAILQAFLNQFDFRTLRIDDSLRLFLQSIHLPADFGAAHDLLDAFAGRWAAANQGAGLVTPTVSGLVLSIMELNDALHSEADHGTSYSNIFSFPNPKFSETDFIASARARDQSRSVNDRLLHEVYVSLSQDAMGRQIAPDKIPLPVTVQPPLSRHLSYTSPAAFTVTLPRVDKDLRIRLHGKGLGFDPPVLTFERSRSCSFAVVGWDLGPSAIHFVRLGPSSTHYTGLPLVQPVVIARAFMEDPLHLSFVSEGRERSFVYGFDSPTARDAVLEAVQKAPSRGTRDDADRAALAVLQRTLLPPPSKGKRPTRSHSHSRLYVQTCEGREKDLQLAQLKKVPAEQPSPYTLTGTDLVNICIQNSLLPAAISYLHLQPASAPHTVWL